MRASDFFLTDFDPAALNALGYALDGGYASGALKEGHIWNFADGNILATKTGSVFFSPYYTNTSAGTDLTSSGLTHYSDGVSSSNISDNSTSTYVQYYTYIAVDLGSGNAQAIGSLRLYISTAGNITAVNGRTLYGSNDSTNGVDGTWTPIYTTPSSGAAAGWNEFTVSSSAYRWYKIDGPNDGSAIWEWELLGASVNDATLIPSAVSVSSAPSRMTVYFLVYPVDTVTLGTDLKVRVSRDGGSNWSAFGAVAEVVAYDASYNLIKADFPASALPATGTSLKWELTTYNGKEIRVRAAALFVE